MMLLQNKVVVVTGSSQGIGRAIALSCAKHGANIVLHYLGDESTTRDVRELEKEIQTLGSSTQIVGGDIGDVSTAAAIVDIAKKRFGRIDVLVSNAGICPFHAFLTMPHDLWHKVQQVNLNGAFYIVQAVANQMQSQHPQGGSIIAISSVSAIVGGEYQSHYTPTKAGLASLMQSCSIALGKYNIRCNSILPGTIETKINEEDLRDNAKRKYMESRTCLKRLGRPEDLGGPVVFLASEELSGYVTGASLVVDGGLLVNLQ